jgi:hypothetical protein
MFGTICIIGTGITAGTRRRIPNTSSGNKGVLLVVMVVVVFSVVIQNSQGLI